MKSSNRIFLGIIFLLSLLILFSLGCEKGDDEDKAPSSDSGNLDDDDDDDNDDNDDDNDDNNDDDNNDDDIIDSGGLIPGPPDSGYDADLENKALRYAHLFQKLLAYPLGMSLEAGISDQGMRNLVDDFAVNSALTDTFEGYTGVPVYSVMDGYGEFGDLGMFGGMASLGDIYRYAYKRDYGGNDPVPLAELRQNLITLMETLHICIAITGHHGGIVRGLRPRGLPGGDPATTPMFDPYGNPLPAEKDNTYREDNSIGGLYPDYMWEDNTSKDQFDGFVLSMGAVWDVIANDPDIPDGLKSRLQEDAAALGDHLMTIAPETGLDLTLRDADGRLTTFHDLNPLEIEGVVLPSLIGNGFNALMALGVVKTIAFITGDTVYQEFYEELVYDRNFPKYVDQTLKFTNVGPYTNWSNINMVFCAIWPLLRYEADDELRDYYKLVLERDLWGSYFPGWSVARTHQAYFAIIHAAFAQGATDDAEADLAGTDLKGYPDPPYWNAPYIENCDATELAAGECLAIDGTTIIKIAGIDIGGTFYIFPGHGDDPQAADPVPRHVRPPSNFNWRSSPYEVNGGGGHRLNPGGCFHGTYWLGRYMRRANDSDINLSELAM